MLKVYSSCLDGSFEKPILFGTLFARLESMKSKLECRQHPNSNSAGEIPVVDCGVSQ